MTTTHALKTDAAVFAAVLSGAKTHEIRNNDRAFAVGDELLLRETTRTGAEIAAGAPLEYTGRTVTRNVSHVLTGYGLLPDWCILSFAATSHASTAQAEGTAKRMRDLAAGRITGEIKSFEYSLAADRIQDLEGIIDQLKSVATSSTDAQAAAEVRNAILDEAIAVIPGGSICDPQQVADAIRALRAGDTGEQADGGGNANQT